jgi:hypothetical protein
MRTIGIRAEPTVLHFAIVDGEPSAPKLFATDKLLLQQQCSGAEALSILRTQFLNVLNQNKPEAALVRLPDRPKGQTNVLSMFERARVEGVILESLASFGIPVIGGMSQTIKSKMKTKRPIREYVKEDDIRGIDLRKIKNKSRREAIIAAISALGG